MASKTTAIDIDITLRHLNGDGAAVKQHVLNKLTGVVRALPAVKRASVEVTYEASRPRHQQYIVQATLTVGGTVLRAEEMGRTHAPPSIVYETCLNAGFVTGRAESTFKVAGKGLL